MPVPSIPATSFVLYDLEENLAAQLCQAVSDSGRGFCSAGSPSDCLALAERLEAGVVFCNAQPNQYRPLIDALKQKGLRLPVVVVSRLPDTTEWLDALEAGAMDYCGAPFEQHQMQWLLQSALLASQ